MEWPFPRKIAGTRPAMTRVEVTARCLELTWKAAGRYPAGNPNNCSLSGHSKES